MIQEFVNKFMESEAAVRERFQAAHPDDYGDIVKAVVSVLHDEEGWDSPDPERIHVIDDGDYQGTLLYVIAAQGYQPSNYWAVKVDYGSCSGCDTLEDIREYSDNPPTEQQVNDYMTLALHIVQGLKEV